MRPGNLKKSGLFALMTLTGVALIGCSRAKPPVDPPPTTGGGDTDNDGRLPNLEVTSFDPNIRFNGDVILRGKVRNSGLARARLGSRVAIYLQSSEQGKEGESSEIGSAEIQPIRVGGTREFRIEIQKGSLPVGPVNLVALADAGNAIDEGEDGGEDDNTARRFIQYGPDLALTRIVKRDIAKDENSFKIRAVFKNFGSYVSDATTVQLYKLNLVDPEKDQANSTPVGGDTANTSASSDPETAAPEPKLVAVPLEGRVEKLGRIGPNGSRVVTFKIERSAVTEAGFPGGGMAFLVGADPENQVPELDEENNGAGVDHLFPFLEPDLHVWGLMARYRRISKVIKLNAFLVNVGQGPTGEFTSQWFRAGNVAGTQGEKQFDPIGTETQHANIPPTSFEGFDEARTIPWTPTNEDEGQRVLLRYEAGVKDGQLAGETNKRNNSMEWNFKVPVAQIPDLSADATFAWVYQQGRRIRALSFVRNRGNRVSEPYKVTWALDGENMSEAQQAPLPPGRSRWIVEDFRIRGSYRKAGKVTIRFAVSSEGEDRNGDNNSREFVRRVPQRNPIGPDLVVKSVESKLTKSDPSDPELTLPDLVESVATIYNAGDRGAGKIAYTISVLKDGGGDQGEDQFALLPQQEARIPYTYKLRDGDYGKTLQVQYEVSTPNERERRQGNNSGISNEVPVPPRMDGTPKFADLTVENIALIKKDGNKVTIRATVKNIGKRAAAGFQVVFRVNGQEIDRSENGDDVVKYLAPGSAAGGDAEADRPITVEYEVAGSNASSVDVLCTVDPADIIPEENESYTSNQLFKTLNFEDIVAEDAGDDALVD